MSIVLQSSGGGSVTIQEPTTASNFTATMPAATGTVMVSGNMPAFSSYMNTNQSISNGVWTKANFNTEFYDTANCFDTSNGRFTPNVAGYYQINATLYISVASIPSAYGLAFYKNGSPAIYFYTAQSATYATADVYPFASYFMYLNGSTDYVEVYGYAAGTTPTLFNTSSQSLFQAVLVRGA